MPLYKKAFSSVMMEVVVLILVVVVILASGKWTYSMASSLFGNKQGTVESFEIVSKSMQALANSQTVFASDNANLMILQDSYVIVGFDKTEQKSVSSCESREAQKPPVCAGSACICLFKFDALDKPVQCTILYNVDRVFTINYDSDYSSRFKVPEAYSFNSLGSQAYIFNDNYKSSFSSTIQGVSNPAVSYSHLFLFGNCPNEHISRSFAAHNFYIEKFVDATQKKTYFLVAYADEFTIAHSEEIRKKFGSKSPAEYEKLISELLASKNPEQAVAKFSEFKAAYPLANLSNATYQKLLQYLLPKTSKEELAIALQIVDDYLKFFPNDDKTQEMLYNQGLFNMLLDDVDAAKESFDKVIETNAKSELAKKAEDMLDAVSIIKEDPGLTGESSQATIKRLTEEISSEKDDSKLGELHYGLGVAYLVANIRSRSTIYPRDLAVNEFATVISKYPVSEYADVSCYNLGLVYSSLAEQNEKDHQKACEYFAKVYQDYPFGKSVFNEDLSTLAADKIKRFDCNVDEYDTFDSSSYTEPAPSDVSTDVLDPKLQGLTPETVEDVKKLQTALNAKFVIHEGYATTGHLPGSLHYVGKAVDFHITGTSLTYLEQIDAMNQALIGLKIADNGFGIYPDWRNPGFHFDTRGKVARWGWLSKHEVSYQAALDYAKAHAPATAVG
ncbi:MAG: tetratricopeptide repeat protein [Candidatus Woesearchaeota archaeon]